MARAQVKLTGHRKSDQTVYEATATTDKNGVGDYGPVTVDGVLLDPKPSQDVRNHSPDGFAWGYAGSGPSQLALAILMDWTQNRVVAERSYHEFKFAFVANAPREAFKVTGQQIHDWLNIVYGGEYRES